MRVSKFIAILVLTIIVALLVTYNIDAEPTETAPKQVEWIEINPPPGVDGPCFAYFDGAIYSYKGYSGVYCK